LVKKPPQLLLNVFVSLRHTESFLLRKL